MTRITTPLLVVILTGIFAIRIIPFASPEERNKVILGDKILRLTTEEKIIPSQL
jgi:hypothetical protein